MSILLANVKRREDQNVVIFNDERNLERIRSLFVFDQNRSHPIEYDNEHRLEQDEYFYVDLSGEQMEEVQQVYHLNNQSNGDLNIGGFGNEYDKIQCLYYLTNSHAIFKKVFKNNFLHERGFIRLEGAPSFEQPNNALSFDQRVDVHLDLVSNRMKFISYRNAVSLFPCLYAFFQEATATEVGAMLDDELFELDEDFNKSSVGTNNRKKIAYAINSLEVDLAGQKDKIAAYAAAHDSEGIFSDGKFVIKNNADLTKAMLIITGAYYPNAITGDEMVAKVSRKVEL